MARSKTVSAIEVVWLASRRILAASVFGSQQVSEQVVTVWVRPERMQLHELTTAATRLLGGSPPSSPGKPAEYITTHTAFHNGTEALWVVQLWPEAPRLMEEQEGVKAHACYFPDRDTFKAAIAILPIERWGPDMLREQVLREWR